MSKLKMQKRTLQAIRLKYCPAPIQNSFRMQHYSLIQHQVPKITQCLAHQQIISILFEATIPPTDQRQPIKLIVIYRNAYQFGWTHFYRPQPTTFLYRQPSKHLISSNLMLNFNMRSYVGSLCPVSKIELFQTPQKMHKSQKMQEEDSSCPCSSLHDEPSESFVDHSSNSDNKSDSYSNSDNEYYYMLPESHSTEHYHTQFGRDLPQAIEKEATNPYDDYQYPLPQLFLERFMYDNEIMFKSDLQVRENVLLYNLTLRLKHENRIDPRRSKGEWMQLAFSYQQGYRGLFNYKVRQAGERVVELSRKQLIDLSRSLDCDLIEVMKKDRKFDSTGELVKRVVFLFESRFIKADYNLEKRRSFRQAQEKWRQAQRGRRQPKFNSHVLPKELSKRRSTFTRRQMQLQEILQLYLQLLPKNYLELPSMDPRFGQHFEGDREVIQKRQAKENNIKQIYYTIREQVNLQRLVGYWNTIYEYKVGSSLYRLFHKHFTLENISWCYNVIATRSFSVTEPHRYRKGELTFLAPVIDLVNHSYSNNCEWGYDQEDKVFYLEATKAIGVGEEFTIKYGSICNLNLLMNYGICQLDNKEESGVSIYPSFDELFDVRTEEEGYRYYHVLVQMFPWLIECKDEQKYKQFRRSRNNPICLNLCSNQFETSLRKAIRKLFVEYCLMYQNEYPEYLQQLDYRDFRYTPLISKIVDYFLGQVLKILKVKDANLRRVEAAQEKDLTSKQHCVVLLKEQIRSCVGLRGDLRDFGKRVRPGFAESLK